MFIAEIDITKKIIVDTLFSLIIFSLLTSTIYATNNYIDKKIDAKNLMKKNIKTLPLNEVFFLNIIVIGLLMSIYIYFEKYFGYSLIAYYLLFFAYSLILKKIKFIDITCLICFHMFRLTYGLEVFKLDISYWFLFFFILLFFFLATLKRVVQINVNNLKKNNKIIDYDKNDINLLKKLSNFTIILLIILSILYVFKDQNQILMSFGGKNTPLINHYSFYVFSFIIFYLILIRTQLLVFKKKIKNDIFNFFLNDKLSRMAILVFITFVFLLK